MTIFHDPLPIDTDTQVMDFLLSWGKTHKAFAFLE